MKAVVCEKLALNPDEALVYKEIPSPVLSENAKKLVKVRIHACGLNFKDVLSVAGQYQVKSKVPFIPGSEIAGEVIEVSKDVKKFNIGDRVAALVDAGGFAEEIVVDESTLIPIPQNLPYEIAVSFIVSYGTAHVGLEYQAKLKKGETILITAAAGGVGLAACQIAKKMGATVIACVGGTDKEAIAKSVGGADFTIDYSQMNTSKDYIREKVHTFTKGKGVDVIFDPVGGDVFEQCFKAAKWSARIIIVGFANGKKIQSISANLLLVKNITVHGLYWGSWMLNGKQDIIKKSLMQLFMWVMQGELKPHVGNVFELKDAAKAMHALYTRKSTGKVVVVTQKPLNNESANSKL